MASSSFLVACGDGSSSGSLEVVPSAEGAEEVSISLCRAWRSARSGDVGAARMQFDAVHGSLHSVATSLISMDRSLAGRFLEFKASVEESLGGNALALSSALESLLQVTNEAAETLGTSLSDCGS